MQHLRALMRNRYITTVLSKEMTTNMSGCSYWEFQSGSCLTSINKS